jgi:hypothetical protein
MKCRKTNPARRTAAKKPRKRNGVLSTFVAGAVGAAGSHAVHKVKQWAQKRKAAKAKTTRTAKKPVASVKPPAAIGEVASALRNLGYKAEQAKAMAKRAHEQTASNSFDTLFRAAMAGAKRNPLTSGSKRKPAVASKRARNTFSMFTGAKSKKTIVRRTKAKLPGKDFAKIGDLVSLTIGNRKVSFEGDTTQPIVVTDAKAKRLFFLGGNQDLRMLKPVRKANPGGMHDMGEVDQVEYYARKKFDDFRPTVYFHNLGEENGKKPRLMWDPKARQMYLVGGDYKIRDVGIVN